MPDVSSDTVRCSDNLERFVKCGFFDELFGAMENGFVSLHAFCAAATLRRF